MKTEPHTPLITIEVSEESLSLELFDGNLTFKHANAPKIQFSLLYFLPWQNRFRRSGEMLLAETMM